MNLLLLKALRGPFFLVRAGAELCISNVGTGTPAQRRAKLAAARSRPGCNPPPE